MYYVLRTYKIVTVIIVIMTGKPVYFQLRMTPVLNCLSFTVCMIVVYYNSLFKSKLFSGLRRILMLIISPTGFYKFAEQ